MTKDIRIMFTVPPVLADWLDVHANSIFVDRTEYIRSFLSRAFLAASKEGDPTKISLDDFRLISQQNHVGSPRITVVPSPSSSLPADADEPQMQGPFPTKTGWRGVYPYGRNQFMVYLIVNGKKTKVGNKFDTALEAAYAYDEAYMKQHGSINTDNLNLPDSPARFGYRPDGKLPTTNMLSTKKVNDPNDPTTWVKGFIPPWPDVPTNIDPRTPMVPANAINKVMSRGPRLSKPDEPVGDLIQLTPSPKVLEPSQEPSQEAPQEEP